MCRKKNCYPDVRNLLQYVLGFSSESEAYKIIMWLWGNTTLPRK